MKLFTQIFLHLVEFLTFPWDDVAMKMARGMGEFYLGITGRWSYGEPSHEDDEWRVLGVGCFIWCLILSIFIVGIVAWFVLRVPVW